jgi:preprotein translocase subunit YajC
MFTSTAYAQTAIFGSDFQAQLQGFLPIILIIGVFYFLLIRPQQQKLKQLKLSQANLRRGDKIVTAGGVIGTVARVINDEEVEVQIAEAVKVRIVRSTISTILAKTEPAGKDAKPADVTDVTPVAEGEAPAPKKRRTTTTTTTAK